MAPFSGWSTARQNKFCFQTVILCWNIPDCHKVNPSNNLQLQTHQHSPVSSWPGAYSLCTLNILNKKEATGIRLLVSLFSFCSFSSCQCYLPSNLHLLKFKVATKLCARVEILCHVLKRNMVNKRLKCEQMSRLKQMVTLLIWNQCHLRDVHLRSGMR